MNEAKLAERIIQLCPELMGENRRPSAVVRNPRTVLALVELIEDLLENDREWRVHSSVLADQQRVFFRKYRSAKDIVNESKRPFSEFKENMPQLQIGMFDPIDIEEDCGAGCEIY